MKWSAYACHHTGSCSGNSGWNGRNSRSSQIAAAAWTP
eukprot:CAMPEP_0180262770 /NCGR_PEP_ID=MMETSP0987-20121128/44911_1 /TAXON_ID=697907 /ORGANISM="non described non described, Strain CCMP2293" /LENGTH=37 /DNA_ID= /DNA_START= /DNA_END= /DNA_ORIENTATION=